MFVVILHSGSSGTVTEAGFNPSIFHYEKCILMHSKKLPAAGYGSGGAI